MKSGISLQKSWHNLWLNLLIVIYCSVPIGLGSLILSLTPKLWEPSILKSIWARFASVSDIPGAFPSLEASPSACMTFRETQSATLNNEYVKSSFYGPGVYFGWLLLTYSAAISSIANAKCASNHRQKPRIEWELVPVISYPLLAALDIVLRLVGCRIDHEISAATSVMFTTLSIFGPTRRLSVQSEGAELFELFDGLLWLHKNMRFVTWLVPSWTCHAIVAAIISEPYSNIASIRALYLLLFLVVVYSGLVGEYHFEKGKYVKLYRPWQERVVVFCLAQILFVAVVMRPGSHWLWRPGGLSQLLDIDQLSAFICATACIFLSNRKVFVSNWERRQEVGRRTVTGSSGQRTKSRDYRI